MNPVFFSKDSRVIGLWFGAGLEQALAARAALGQLQAEHAEVSWVLFGPKSSACLFEMDGRVQAYVPLLSLEPPRPAQSRLSRFLERRAQNRQLAGLKLEFCFGVKAISEHEAKSVGLAQMEFEAFLRALKVKGSLIQNSLAVFLAHKRPVLQAGPQALAFATRLHRQTPPSFLKQLVLLSNQFSENAQPVDEQWESALAICEQQSNVYTTTALVGVGSKLQIRLTGRKHPDWLLIDLSEALGLLAYADRVVCSSPDLVLVCAEMGRSDRLVLGKCHS